MLTAKVYQLLICDQVDTTTRKMDDLKKDCDMRIKEYAEMLDIRAERIKVCLFVLPTLHLVFWLE